MALLLDLFDKEILDSDDQPFMFMQKAPAEFFERVVGLLPMHIAFMNNANLLKTLEVLVKRNLGSERLFLHYIYMRIERNDLKFSTEEYVRTIRALADKGYSEDRQFWEEFMFKYCFEKAKPKGAERFFTPSEAKEVWDTLMYLQLKCPDLQMETTLKQVEKFMPIAQKKLA
jgi:hypothetical protein